MIKDNIQLIKDDSLRITATVLSALLNNSYCLSELSKSLKLPSELLISIIKHSLNQNIFEFYAGNNLITPSNIHFLLNDDSKDSIYVISKASITDKDTYDRFYAMLDNYYDSIKKNEVAKNIMIINEYTSYTPTENEDFLVSIHNMLSELKTAECICKLDFTSFFPFALYRNRSNRQEYLVSLFQNNDTWEIRFFPTAYVHFKNDKPQKISLNKICDHQIRIIALDVLKKIWGPHDISLSEEPISVKAIIHDSNCITKIKHDISNRHADLKENADGTFSLMVDILGYESFISWVLSYGSSIEILEPLSLRTAIKNTYNEICKAY